MESSLLVIETGVDSIRLHFVTALEDIPGAVAPEKTRAYTYCPCDHSKDGFDWWIFVDPCSDMLLICELLAHEATHVLDYVDYAWGADGPTEKTCLGEARAYLAQAIVRRAPAFWEPAEG